MGRVASVLNLNRIAFHKNVRRRTQPILICFDQRHLFSGNDYWKWDSD